MPQSRNLLLEHSTMFTFATMFNNKTKTGLIMYVFDIITKSQRQCLSSYNVSHQTTSAALVHHNSLLPGPWRWSCLLPAHCWSSRSGPGNTFNHMGNLKHIHFKAVVWNWNVCIKWNRKSWLPSTGLWISDFPGMLGPTWSSLHFPLNTKNVEKS